MIDVGCHVIISHVYDDPPTTVCSAGQSILCGLFLLFAFACQDVHNHNSVSTLSNKH
jgi:hypothetical protein